jgi:hypothetical protein
MLVAGYGFSGKTMAAQSLALSVATGRPVWGAWSVARRGRVVHVDFEQGERLTAERYQRLAHGMGVSAEDIGDRLAIVPLPRVSLATPEGRAMLRELAEGAALVIVDSLRACAPELDENSSEVRAVLDTMTSVSEEAGACFVVVHHARKPTQDAAGGAKASIRGSGAIFDACASVLVFSGEKGAPVDVTHEKARTSGITADDFALVIADVDGRAGLRVDVSGETRATRAQAAQATAHAERVAAVVAYVAEHPGCGSHELRTALGGRKSAADQAIHAAVAARKIHDRGPGGDRSPRRYYVAPWPASEALDPGEGHGVVDVAPPKGGGPRATYPEAVAQAVGATRGHAGPRVNGSRPPEGPKLEAAPRGHRSSPNSPTRARFYLRLAAPGPTAPVARRARGSIRSPSRSAALPPTRRVRWVDRPSGRRVDHDARTGPFRGGNGRARTRARPGRS